MTDIKNLEIYQKLGFIELKQFFKKDKIDNMNKIIDNLDLIPSDTVFFEGTKVKQIQYLQNYDKIFQDIIDELRPIAQKLTYCEDLYILNMQLFEKHPQISKPTRPHQDNAYFKMTPALPITFWISLDNIDEQNGCLY